MSTNALPVQVALVSQSPKIGLHETVQVAAAINKQVTRDFGPAWKVNAQVHAFHDIKHVPPGYWPVLIQDQIDDPNAAGFHLDQHKQPQAFVSVEGNWPLTVSHETLEMLADPWGNRLHSAYAPGQYTGQGRGSAVPRVRFLVEVCDPCEDESCSYEVDGYPMSDFVLPDYYRSTQRGARCSFTGAITAPRSILPGGYVSYVDADHEWWQQTWFGGAEPGTTRLEMNAGDTGSLRASVDQAVRAQRSHR